MLSGLYAQNNSFLMDLSRIETRITTEDKQITSGVRVNQASDDPSAVVSILQYQGEIDRVTQVQTNLTVASTDASSADSALQTASTLLEKIDSLASQGATFSASATTRTTLGQQVQQLADQLVSLANTSSGGKYIFGGDDPSTQPYTSSWSTAPVPQTAPVPPAVAAPPYNSPGGVLVKTTTFSSTSTIANASGSTIVPKMTAQQIFDARNPDGTVASGNVFQAVYEIGQALQNNSSTFSTDIATGIADLKNAIGTVSQATQFYGNTETWIQSASNDTSTQITSIQQLLTTVRDTDVASAITQLTTDQAAQQAAISAHATLPTKNLFSYLG